MGSYGGPVVSLRVEGLYVVPRPRVLPVHVDAAVLAVRRLQEGGTEWVLLRAAHDLYTSLPLGEVAHVGLRQFGNAVMAAQLQGRLEVQTVSHGRGGMRGYVRTTPVPGGSR